MDNEKIIGMIEVGVGLKKDNIKLILEGMMEVAIGDPFRPEEAILLNSESFSTRKKIFSVSENLKSPKCYITELERYLN